MNYKKVCTTILILMAMTLLAIGCSSGSDPSAGIESGETVEWETAVSILNAGDVEVIFQSHNLDVTLNLKDGRRIHTVEPSIDDIFDEVKACGDPCANIALATE